MADVEVVQLLTTPWVKTLFFCVGCAYLLIPLVACKLLLNFYGHRNNPIVLKRYPRVTMLFMIGAIVGGIGTSLVVISMANYLALLQTLAPIYFLPGPLMVLGSITIRFWMIRFDTKFARIGLSKQWQILINSKYGEHNWYIQHKSTFGNIKFMTKLIFSCLTIVALADLVFLAYGMTQGWIIEIVGPNLLLFGIPMIVVVYCYCTINPMDDDFFILAEASRYIKIMSAIPVCAVLCFGTAQLISVLNSYDEEQERETMAIGFMIFFFCVNMSLLFMCYTSANWALSKLDVLMNTSNRDYSSEHSSTGHSSSGPENKHPTTLLTPKGSNTPAANKNDQSDSNRISHVFNKSQDLDEISKKLAKSLKRVTVSKIFNDKRALAIFFEHLSNEFSIEVGISVIEFLQFLKHLIKVFDLKNPRHKDKKTVSKPVKKIIFQRKFARPQAKSQTKSKHDDGVSPTATTPKALETELSPAPPAGLTLEPTDSQASGDDSSIEHNLTLRSNSSSSMAGSPDRTIEHVFGDVGLAAGSTENLADSNKPSDTVLEMVETSVHDKEIYYKAGWKLADKFTFFEKIAQSEIIEKGGEFLQTKKKRAFKREDIESKLREQTEDGSSKELESEAYEKKLLECRKIAYGLFRKYIRADASDFEININWNERDKLSKIMGQEDVFLGQESNNMNEKDLFVLYVPCVQEMIKLLEYSLSRMKAKTEMYAQIEAIVLKK